MHNCIYSFHDRKIINSDIHYNELFLDMFRLIADQARKSNQRKLGLLLSDCIQVMNKSIQSKCSVFDK